MNEVRTLGMGCLRTQSSLVLGPWLSTKNDAGQHKNSLLGFPYLHGKLGHVVHKAHLSLGTERPGHLSNLGWQVKYLGTRKPNSVELALALGNMLIS